MADTPKPPGGWLQPEEVSVVQRALRAYRATLLARAQSVRSGPLGVTEDALGRAALIDADADRLRQASVVFDGIEHGARVEAMASPEEERAQEEAYRAERCACDHTRREHRDGYGSCAGDEADGCCCSGFVHA